MRLPDWENNLNDYIASVRNKKFRYGRFDCVTFTMGAVKAITGEDKTGGLKWSNRKEAEAILEEKPLYDRLCETFEQCPPAFAKRGDVAYYEGACGVVIGRYALFCGDTWKIIPITQLESAFRA